MKNTTQYYCCCCLTHCGGSRYVLNTILCPSYHLPPLPSPIFCNSCFGGSLLSSLVVYEKIPPRLLPLHLPFLSAHIPLVASHKSIGSSQLVFNDAFAIFFDIIFKVLSFNLFTCLYLFILELEKIRPNIFRKILILPSPPPPPPS